MVETIMFIEDRLSVSISDAFMTELQTINKIANYIEENCLIDKDF